VTLDDLARTLGEAVATGRIGTPVALRVHAVLLDENGDPAGVFACLMRRLAEPLFGAPERLAARGDSAGRILDVLVSYAAGWTALLTLGRMPSPPGRGMAPRLDLLVVGNRGVLRLEGGECFAGVDDGAAAGIAGLHDRGVDLYGEAVAHSLRAGQPVPLGSVTSHAGAI
jgi:hypothetical protein